VHYGVAAFFEGGLGEPVIAAISCTCASKGGVPQSGEEGRSPFLLKKRTSRQEQLVT